MSMVALLDDRTKTELREGIVTEADLAQARREKGWTETRTRVALALFNGGLSMSEVAAEIGGVTRNAVIGRIHRSGLSEDNRKASRAAGQARARRRRDATDAGARRPSQRRKALPVEAPPPLDIVDQQIPVEQRRTLAQLDGSCCHWPVGDPQGSDFFFCGAAKPDDGRPYCRSHQARSQQRDARPRKAAGAAFLNTGPSAPWRAR